jgi:ABC-2 type transport system permease protein
MIANAGKELENAKYATFFTLFNSDGIVMGELSAIWQMIVLFAGAAALFATAIVIFSKKDLHI